MSAFVLTGPDVRVIDDSSGMRLCIRMIVPTLELESELKLSLTSLPKWLVIEVELEEAIADSTSDTASIRPRRSRTRRIWTESRI
jgi:hypothetical protein